jgi:glycosyltransferase involved in cell wall biosynthesis
MTGEAGLLRTSDNSMKQLVSVIIPVYNGESFLGEAIESILAQTYSPLELIVVDDGSTDRTSEIARSYPQIIYIRQTNGGTAAARNQGIQAARGEYLAFLDSDDVWLPGKLTLQMKAFEADPTLEIVSGFVEQFVSLGESLQDAGKYAIPSTPSPGYIFSAILIKRGVFNKLGLFHENHLPAETVSWFAEALEKKPNLLMLPDIVARRRIHGKNMSITSKQEKNHEILHILKRTIDRKRANGPRGTGSASL